MIDAKSKLVLKILSKECGNGYKIVEIPDIIMALPKRFRMDSENVKHILTHLERQDMISIKYDDDDIYCVSVLPFGYETLESEQTPQSKKSHSAFWSVLLCFLGSLVGGFLGALAFFFISKGL